MARARRWVVGLALVDMRWISEVGVRCGRVDGGGFVVGWGDENGGGVLGVVVVIKRIVVGWSLLGRRCNEVGRNLVDPRVIGFGVLFGVWKDEGGEKRCDGVG